MRDKNDGAGEFLTPLVIDLFTYGAIKVKGGLKENRSESSIKPNTSRFQWRMNISVCVLRGFLPSRFYVKYSYLLCQLAWAFRRY